MKYRSKSVIYKGIYFPSTGECDRYKYLEQRREAGEISNLLAHPRITLIQGQDRATTIDWNLDTLYVENGVTILEDFKGVETRDFALKKKLFRIFGKGTLRVCKKFPIVGYQYEDIIGGYKKIV